MNLATNLPSDVTPARFTLSAGTITMRPESPAQPPDATRRLRDANRGDAMIAGEGEVSVPARLLASRPVVYPSAARAAGVEMDLPVEIVVEVDGRVSLARALRPVGYGLDEAAQAAMGEYRFSPAILDGHPVRVRMRWTVQFRLL